MRATTLLTSTENIINALCDLVPTLHSHESASTSREITINSLRNYLRQCANYVNTANFLCQRAQTTAQLLSNTLSLRDQVIAKEQNKYMLGLNKSAVFVTTLTLFYVPASFVAVSRISYHPLSPAMFLSFFFRVFVEANCIHRHFSA